MGALVEADGSGLTLLGGLALALGMPVASAVVVLPCLFWIERRWF